MRPLIILSLRSFKNISLERKAALYREEPPKTRVRGATTAAGTMAGMTFGINGRDGHDRIQFSGSKDADDSHRRRNGLQMPEVF